MDFAKSPGKVGHHESALLIEDVYKKNLGKGNRGRQIFSWVLRNGLLPQHKEIAVLTGYIKPQESDRLFG